jgi:hypothetical protein
LTSLGNDLGKQPRRTFGAQPKTRPKRAKALAENLGNWLGMPKRMTRTCKLKGHRLGLSSTS